MHYQIDVVFILGMLDAFGVLTGIQMSEKRLRKLMLHLVLGSIMKHTDVPSDIFLMDLEVKDSNPLYQTFARILEQKFGLTASECQSAIHAFWAYPFELDEEFH
ncbi:hypothetical protein [Dictyobacter kobayashii]|uniref:Uncharacterized protein n=1 Tax=Dictyobacter kobayashii TaxID=2014872 RepID=A0A402AVM0_9CHLR|nr:hypothetical protein [Dictyobacter kobayashii]GCE23124.1 hypothetical protein KDK_69240 [Dictyobacter kobayashii]